jgi:hypothetical protein
MGTKNVGVCKAGSRACEVDGQGWSDCEGEILPAMADDCVTPEDDDCDGIGCSEVVCDLGWQGAGGNYARFHDLATELPHELERVWVRHCDR